MTTPYAGSWGGNVTHTHEEYNGSGFRAPGQALRIGVAGPVGTGKTATVLALCRELQDSINLAVVTNDIYCDEDALFLKRQAALSDDRIIGVATGSCPHAAIREDASLNMRAIEELERRHAGLEPIPIESGGDNRSAPCTPGPRARRRY